MLDTEKKKSFLKYFCLYAYIVLTKASTIICLKEGI